MIARAIGALERFVLPNACVACDRLIEANTPDELVCAVCCARLRSLSGGCARCYQPLPPVGPCRFCIRWSGALRWVRSAVWLGREAREIIHHLKYHDLPALADAAAREIARRVPRPAPSRLVPVALGAKRLRERGFNQAALLAEALGGRWSLPVAHGVLTRIHDAPSQTVLTPEERTANVAGAFEAAAPSPSTPRALRTAVILIDDVLTTGATVAAAAEALAAAGWRGIGAITFARARPYALEAADA